MSDGRRVLVLDGHSRAALETLQSLGRVGADVDIAAVAGDVLAFRSRYAARRLRQPPAVRPQALLGWLRELDARNDYALIVPATEAALSALNVLPDDDPLRAKAVLPPRAAVATALDKEATRRLAQRIGVPVPRTVPVDDAGQPPAALPCVLKPVRSKVAVGGQLVTVPAAVVTDADSRRRYLDLWLPHVAVVEQEYFAGIGVGVEALFAAGELRWHFAHERLHESPLSGGASSYRHAIAAPPALLADTRGLLAALRWHGVAMVEFKLNAAGDYRLLEINPRLWGSLALAIDCGVDFPRALLALASGAPLGDQPAYRIGYRTRNLLDDLRWLHENAVADHDDPLLMTRPVIRAYLELLRPLAGGESWDHFDWRDPRVAVAILGEILRVIGRKLGRKLARRLGRKLSFVAPR